MRNYHITHHASICAIGRWNCFERRAVDNTRLIASIRLIGGATGKVRRDERHV